jgi:cellobiose-specific phosphotransferase system component IIC
MLPYLTGSGGVKFFPSEKFLKSCKMRYLGKVEYLPDLFNISEILNEIPLVLVPIFLE